MNGDRILEGNQPYERSQHLQWRERCLKAEAERDAAVAQLKERDPDCIEAERDYFENDRDEIQAKLDAALARLAEIQEEE